jgi:hypothetical protein
VPFSSKILNDTSIENQMDLNEASLNGTDPRQNVSYRYFINNPVKMEDEK